MRDFEKFKRKRQLQVPAENMKMVVVVLLLLSVMVFTAIGEDNVKPIIWYWAAAMGLAVVACAIQDLIIARRIKREKL